MVRTNKHKLKHNGFLDTIVFRIVCLDCKAELARVVLSANDSPAHRESVLKSAELPKFCPFCGIPVNPYDEDLFNMESLQDLSYERERRERNSE